MIDEIDYEDTGIIFETKAQKELRESKEKGIEPYDDSLDGWNDIQEEEKE